MNALGAPVAHTNAVTAPARAIQSRLSSSRFPRDVSRGYTRETCRTVGRTYMYIYVDMCVCVGMRASVWSGWMAHTVVYIRGGGGREVTRQGFNGILFTGFVPRLGKHSASADPSGRLSSLTSSYIGLSKSSGISETNLSAAEFRLVPLVRRANDSDRR